MRPALVVCFALALVTVIVLSWVPSSDPWAWIDWGQGIASRIVGPRIGVGLAGGPSWKPFPAFFTSIFGLFGSAAPHLWLLVARASALLALAAAFRLGKRFAGPLAGAVAVVALCLSQDWLFYFARGASEPVVAALTLWGIDRHLAGSRRIAYALAVLAALNRPEFYVIVVPYAAYLWLRVPSARALAAIGLALVPFAWLVPPWVISGDPLQASNAALGGKGSPGGAIAELRTSSGLMGPATLVLGAAGLALAYRAREHVLMWLGAGAIAWALMVSVITQIEFGIPRYLLPAGAVACVLAGVGVVRIAELAGGYVRSLRPADARTGVPVVLAAVIVLAATLPWTLPRFRDLGRQSRDADLAAHIQSRLFDAVDRVGGPVVVLPCLSSRVAVNHSLASALAWKLKAPLRRVHPVMQGTGYVFSARRSRDTGTPPPIKGASTHAVHTVAVVPPWTVREVTRLGAGTTPHCAPGDKRNL